MRAVWIALAAAAMAAVVTAAAQEPFEPQVSRGQVDDDLFLSGRSVDVASEVAGDVFAAGGTVDVAGSVGDELIAAGGMVDAKARVAGDALVAGGMVEAAGSVGDNLVVAGGHVIVEADVTGKAIASGGRVRLDSGARVREEAWLAGGSVELAGTVDGSAFLTGGRIAVTGRVDGDLESAGGELYIGSTAQIAGTVTHRGPEPPRVADGATIAGAVDHIQMAAPSGLGVARGWMRVEASAARFVYLFLIGLLMFLLLPGLVRSCGRDMRQRPWPVLGVGVAVIVLTPIAVLLLAATLIGLPLALILVPLYAAAMFVGVPLAGLGLGLRLAEARGRVLGILALGLIVLELVGHVPVLGPLAWLAAMAFGIGAAVRVCGRLLAEATRASHDTAGPPPAPA